MARGRRYGIGLCRRRWLWLRLQSWTCLQIEIEIEVEVGVKGEVEVERCMNDRGEGRRFTRRRVASVAEH